MVAPGTLERLGTQRVEPGAKGCDFLLQRLHSRFEVGSGHGRCSALRRQGRNVNRPGEEMHIAVLALAWTARDFLNERRSTADQHIEFTAQILDR